MQRLRHPPLVTWVGLAIWLAVSAPNFLQAAHSPRFPVWLLAWCAFGAAFLFATRTQARGWVFWLAAAIETASVVTMVALLCDGFEGMLLVLVAAQLGFRTGAPIAAAWVLLQTAAMALAIGFHWSPHSAWLLAPPYLGFEMFALLAFYLLAREKEARQALATANAELLHAQGELADRTRLDERLRIAQELHDALGHRLTAMSLNLEVAAHQTDGAAQENVRTAQSLVRIALRDIREIVRALKPASAIDLRQELERIAAEMPQPNVHITFDADLQVRDRECSHALLRCAQETVTNAIRHGQARNVWIELHEADGEIALVARDDGSGAADVHPGDGLAGMRRRFEQLGGTLAFEGRSGEGFALRATLPRNGGPSR